MIATFSREEIYWTSAVLHSIFGPLKHNSTFLTNDVNSTFLANDVVSTYICP